MAGVIHPFSTIEPHEYDTINLETLGIKLNVPVRSKAGHIPFSFILQGGAGVTYLTKIGTDGLPQHWIYGGAGLAGAETHVGGFRLGGATFSMKQTSYCGTGQLHTGYSEWVYTDLSGAAHPVPLITIWDGSTCGATSAGAYTSDGSGIYVYTSWTGIGYAIDPNGNKVLFGAGTTYTFTDPNGNAIGFSTAYNGSTRTNTYTDTLAQNAITQVISNTALEETDTWTDALANTQQIKLYTVSHPVLTSFGCSLDETSAVSQTFPDHVAFPDGSTLSFTYEKNYSNSADYTGRLASIKLPTGGTVGYAYSGGTNGINCVDVTPATLTRTTPDGVWTYTHTAPQTYGGSPTTTQVKDPQGNNTVYTFVSAYDPLGEFGANIPLQTEKDVYNGAVSGTNLVQTVITCYNSPNSTPTNCNSNMQYPITQKDEYLTYLHVIGYAAVKTTYDTYGRITDIKTYDFNATTPTNERVVAYGSGSPASQTCTAIGNNIIGKPCSITLYDSQHNNAILNQTWNSYDSSGNLNQTWNLVSGSGAGGIYLSKQYTYRNGIVQTMTDVNGQVINYTTTSCNDMFVTSQYPANFTNLETSQAWDCNGGVVTSSTDANGHATHNDFFVNSATDPFYRPLDSKDELNNVTTISYPTPNQTESVFSFNNNLSVIDAVSATDSQGRPVVSQIRQGPGSNNWDTQSRSFDSDGRAYQTSLPCVSTKGIGCSPSTESQTYEALNRPKLYNGTAGDVVAKTYYANDVLTTLTPAPGNENAKSVQKEYDGLGRLKSSCLLSSAAGSGPCGQANGGTGFLTTYIYDAAGRLLQTIENAQVSSPRQVRSYAYDDIGRITSETNPESGTTTYYWDAAAPACYPPNGYPTLGDLGAKRDANGWYSCFGYDGLHRLVGVSYPPTGSNCKGFIYDARTPPTGVNVQNTEGRVVEAYTNSACDGHGSIVTDEWFSYSPRGELTDVYELTPNSGGAYYHLSATYWEDRHIKTVSGVGLPTIYYGTNATAGNFLDGEGRITQVNAGSGANPVSGVMYNNANNSEPVGALLTVTVGAGDTQNFTYDKNTGRMLSYSASVGATPTIISGSLTWNPNGTLQQLNIVDGYNSLDTQDCKYLYDDFVRVAAGLDGTPGVNCLNGSTKIWNQTFSYDSFGNITKSTTGPGAFWACAACYNTANNHYNNVLSGSITYDNDGNLTNDTFHTYTWLQDGHVATIDANTMTYDANGNKVEENVGGLIHEYVSGFGVTAQMTGSTENATTVDLPGGVQALYSGGTLQRFRYPDWQGTIRSESDPVTRQFTESLAFAPFGERYALKGAPYNVDSFTGKPDQIVSDEYDFPARQQHGGQGRWISPDPISGTGNKYAYAENNPLSQVDPYGLEAIVINGLDVGFGSADAEFSGDKFRSPFAQPESTPPASQQTGSQTPSQNASSQGSPSTQTPASQQGGQTQASTSAAEPAKQAQNSGCTHFCWLEVAANWLVGNGPRTNAEVLHANSENLRAYYKSHGTDLSGLSDRQVVDFEAAIQGGNSSLISDGVKIVIQSAVFKVPVPGLSGKEGAKDVPSWARGNRPQVGENGKAFANRLLDKKYGAGNWERGPGSEFSQIQKWADRSFMDPPSQ